jgi:prolyl-tRNA synthetase
MFRRCGLDAVDVQASSGAMGGSESVEFMVRSPAGEDWIVTCETCGYRANLERATSRVDPVDDPTGVGDPERFPTPGIRTIRALADAHPDVAGADRQIKTLVYVLDGELTLVLLRGDHGLQEQKLADVTGSVAVRPAHPEEIREALGADPGSLGGVGVTDHPIVADLALRGRRGMVTGANEDDWHLRSVDVARDITVSRFEDVREVEAGERCVVDGGVLDLWKGIEVGHIFKLGTRYSEAMDAHVLDEDGASRPIVMGSYGIGLERTMAAVVEACHDDAGIVWPVSVAPFEVVVTAVRADDPAVAAAADDLERDLEAAGVDVIVDDRAERPGVKFADAELVGIPFRITIGPRGVAAGEAELTVRAGMETTVVPLDEVVGRVAALVESGRAVGR